MTKVNLNKERAWLERKLRQNRNWSFVMEDEVLDLRD